MARSIMMVVVLATVPFLTFAASAQNLDRPTWNYSAVCPNNYDYVAPWCRLRGYTGDDSAELVAERSIPDSSTDAERAEQGRLRYVHQQAGQAWTLADRTLPRSQMAALAASTALVISVMALFVAYFR